MERIPDNKLLPDLLHKWVIVGPIKMYFVLWFSFTRNSRTWPGTLRIKIPGSGFSNCRLNSGLSLGTEEACSINHMKLAASIKLRYHRKIKGIGCTLEVILLLKVCAKSVLKMWARVLMPQVAFEMKNLSGQKWVIKWTEDWRRLMKVREYSPCYNREPNCSWENYRGIECSTNSWNFLNWCYNNM